MASPYRLWPALPYKPACHTMRRTPGLHCQCRHRHWAPCTPLPTTAVPPPPGRTRRRAFGAAWRTGPQHCEHPCRTLRHACNLWFSGLTCLPSDWTPPSFSIPWHLPALTSLAAAHLPPYLVAFAHFTPNLDAACTATQPSPSCFCIAFARPPPSPGRAAALPSSGFLAARIFHYACGSLRIPFTRIPHRTLRVFAWRAITLLPFQTRCGCHTAALPGVPWPAARCRCAFGMKLDLHGPMGCPAGSGDRAPHLLIIASRFLVVFLINQWRYRIAGLGLFLLPSLYISATTSLFSLPSSLSSSTNLPLLPATPTTSYCHAARAFAGASRLPHGCARGTA